jgi:hypothetical protein
LAIVAFLLIGEASLPLEATAKCRFACVAHKVTDLKRLTLALQTQLGEDEERINQQGAAILALREHNASLEATGASLTAAYAFLGQRFDGLTKCLGEIPLTRYGEPEGPSGYVFQVSSPQEEFSFPTTALDISYDNSPVGAWAFVDVCNKSRVQATSSLDAARFVQPGH